MRQSNDANGEEFRDDLRQAPARLLPANVLRELTELDSSRSVLAVVKTVGLTAATLAAALTWPNPWITVAAIFLVGTQQHAMFVLAHEAAHYRLFRNRTINDLVGRLLAMSAGLSMCVYRVIHRLHHNHLYGEQDPDIALHGGYPRGRGYLLRKLACDICGLTAWKTYRYFFGVPAMNSRTRVAQKPLDDTSAALRRAALGERWIVAAVHIVVPIAITGLFGWAGLVKYLLLWVLPALTVLQAILRLRAIYEHGAPSGYGSALNAARTNLVGPLLRLVMFPHHVYYHIEHHLFPAVPHYNLPGLHAELRSRRILDGAEMRSFGETWRRVYAPARA